jgi:protein involved in polysaccharide export with SLBB domain
VLGRQQRIYNISGTVVTPGAYPLVRPDFRVREAINQAGGLTDMVKTIYVFRNEAREKLVKEEAPVLPGPAMPGTDPPLPAPPVTPVSLAEMGSPGSASPAQASSGAPAPASRPARQQGLTVPADEVEQDLKEALAPPPTEQQEPSTAPEAPQETAPAMPTYIYVNDDFVESPPTATRTLPATTPLEPAPSQPGEAATQPVDWEELAAEGQQRVIRIPAEKIRQGDPHYNIVIRHQDWIELDAGEMGVFYLMGHVVRPGVYSLTGQEITLTQAIAAAGGLDQIAWPTRCELRRRLEGDREEITQWDLARIVAGQDPDFYLKKEDVVTVGTHAVAPLLAMIRNSFRLTYGFGFVYDRNFADIDAVVPQQNPTDRRRNERIRRGLLP